jgi:tetratricopeptide (TPR) repeat protein
VLVQKAWAALDAKDLEAVEAYVFKVNQIYASKAAAMQISLQDYASGSNEQIFKYWALNDVSTAWFILGKAYRAAGKKDDAIKAFNKVINGFSYGQCWDTKGWFWKPAQAAKEEIAMIQSGSNVDFGDYSSSTLVQKAWGSLANNDLKSTEAYVNKADEFYSGKAKDMQASLQTFASGSNDDIFKYWALNDVGTAWFILGEAYQNAGKNEQAAQAYKKVINEYSFAQCWDPKGWFWNPTEAAQQKLMEINVN